MSNKPFENGRIVLPEKWLRSDLGVPEPIETDEAPLGEVTWRSVGYESARLFAWVMLALSLVSLVYLLGWR